MTTGLVGPLVLLNVLVWRQFEAGGVPFAPSGYSSASSAARKSPPGKRRAFADVEAPGARVAWTPRVRNREHVMSYEHDDLHLPDLSISGFRGIEQLSIGRLGRVTLLAGRNGVGKTTVLDAVRVPCGAGPSESL